MQTIGSVDLKLQEKVSITETSKHQHLFHIKWTFSNTHTHMDSRAPTQPEKKEKQNRRE